MKLTRLRTELDAPTQTTEKTEDTTMSDPETPKAAAKSKKRPTPKKATGDEGDEPVR